jgi:hypothetical protein
MEPRSKGGEVAEPKAPKAPKERSTLAMLLVLQQALSSTQDARIVVLSLVVLLVIAIKLNQ